MTKLFLQSNIQITCEYWAAERTTSLIYDKFGNLSNSIYFTSHFCVTDCWKPLKKFIIFFCRSRKFQDWIWSNTKAKYDVKFLHVEWIWEKLWLQSVIWWCEFSWFRCKYKRIRDILSLRQGYILNAFFAYLYGSSWIFSKLIDKNLPYIKICRLYDQWDFEPFLVLNYRETKQKWQIFYLWQSDIEIKWVRAAPVSLSCRHQPTTPKFQFSALVRL